ncbi:MAG: recombinase family protein [Bacteroidales bacterium]|nr:recombinase family protein [Bacteroidales bacterium]
MKAIIYARVSSTTDRQNTERQISDLTKYAEYKGMEVVKTFEEKVSGAKKNSERPILTEAIEYCKANKIAMLLVSELSRLGRNAFEVLDTVKMLVDEGINLYMQKEQFTLLDEEGKPSMFAPIMIATLSTCAQLERENIKFRLNSGRQLYIDKGGKLGRKEGYRKPKEDKAEEYKQVIKFLKQGISIRKTAKLCDVSPSTVQRIKAEFNL